MMDRQELMELFNKFPRIGALATANKEGDVNAAVFGSPRMVDEDTVIMGIGENRSFRNLQRNPKAVFIVMEPGKTVKDWKGAKVYLEAVDMETEGQFYEEIKHSIANMAGQQAAEMIYAAIRFKITEIRPLVDMG
jgi:hypothetical protein